MAPSLISRFTFGNSEWPAAFTPEYEIFNEMPAQQRELLQLGRRQIAAQREAASRIASSNLSVARIVARELESSSEQIEMVVGDLSTTFTDSFESMSGRFDNAIRRLEERTCGLLEELIWQVAQLRGPLLDILKVLQESRSNEARQLVAQGVRCYETGEYQDAEELFQNALKEDRTYYQALMYIGYIDCTRATPPKLWSLLSEP
jgi:tetratricopeptide (TPR) repeat protein